MKSFKSMVGAALALTAAAPVGPVHHMGRSRYPTGHKPNRSCYRPHQGEREIARRLRQKARDEQRQRDRAKSGSAAIRALLAKTDRVSRRGRVITTQQEV